MLKKQTMFPSADANGMNTFTYRSLRDSEGSSRLAILTCKRMTKLLIRGNTDLAELCNNNQSRHLLLSLSPGAVQCLITERAVHSNLRDLARSSWRPLHDMGVHDESQQVSYEKGLENQNQINKRHSQCELNGRNYKFK